MIDIGFTELLLVAVIALIVLGPQRLPQFIRTAVYWWEKIRRSVQSVKDELEREVDTESIRQRLHDEAVMKTLNETQKAYRNSIDDRVESVVIESEVNSKLNQDSTRHNQKSRLNSECHDQQTVEELSAHKPEEKSKK